EDPIETEVDFITALTLSKVDQGQIYRSTGNFGDITQEGIYTLTTEVRDFAGNYAQPHPRVAQVVVDHTPPVILPGMETNNLITNQETLTIPFQVVDISPTKTQAFVNDQLVFETEDEQFEFSLP